MDVEGNFCRAGNKIEGTFRLGMGEEFEGGTVGLLCVGQYWPWICRQYFNNVKVVWADPITISML